MDAKNCFLQWETLAGKFYSHSCLPFVVQVGALSSGMDSTPQPSFPPYVLIFGLPLMYLAMICLGDFLLSVPPKIHFSYSSFPKYFFAGVLGPVVSINKIEYLYCSVFPCWVNSVTPAVIIRDLHLLSDQQILGHVDIFIVIPCS